MPELPEVETIKRGLERFLLNKKIVQVKIGTEKSFVGPKELVEGQKIVGLRRRGKALLVDLSGGVTLMVHLRMTGQLIYRTVGAENGADILAVAKRQQLGDEQSFAGGHPTDAFFTELPNKQTRVEIKLQDGTLFFNDQRKFGFIKVLETREVEDEAFIKKLAPEPWQMKAEEFYQRLQRHKNALIKAVILDQGVIAGLGNIYADEALFMAKIHPARRAGSLSKEEAKELLMAARRVMEKSIESGGSTMATYVRADGTKGDYLEKFAQVFRREGQPCLVCGAEIEKLRVAGRGTHICPVCQKTKVENEIKKAGK
mgnify:FL=1